MPALASVHAPDSLSNQYTPSLVSKATPRPPSASNSRLDSPAHMASVKLTQLVPPVVERYTAALPACMA